MDEIGLSTNDHHPVVRIGDTVRRPTGWFKIHSDDGLRRFAQLLREYHEAIADYRPSQDAEWAYAKGGVKPGETLCHGDFGPWNVV